MRDMRQTRSPTVAREFSRQTFLRGTAGALAAGAVFGSAWPPPLPIQPAGRVCRPPSGAGSAPGQRCFRLGQAGLQYQLQRPDAGRDRHSGVAGRRAEGDGLRRRPQPESGSTQRRAFLYRRVHGKRRDGARPAPAARGINYDAASGTVTVTPATSLYAMHQTLAGAGRGIPTGTCPSVGASGHALGGGLGANSRHAGLLCDQLVSASVVLPGGQAVTASNSSNPDLLWALRGGGAATSG